MTVVRIAIAVVAALVLIRIGLAVLVAIARRPPEPESGELRRVQRSYQCDVCGTEVRMTVAAEADPEPPRHCMEEMHLLSTEE